MDTTDFARSMFMLTNNVPITNLFDEKFGQKKNRWWSCQREHFVSWASHQDTYGVGKYHHEPNKDDSLMYHKIARPEMLLWLIEALHISLERLEPKLQKELKINMNDFKTFVEKVKLIKHYKTKCAKIRGKYPFATIERWLEKHRKLEKIYLTREEFERRNEL
jgi:hypothetical protein